VYGIDAREHEMGYRFTSTNINIIFVKIILG